MMNNLSQGLGSFNNMMPQNNMGQQNPYGQQMNPQMMGQQMRSPEMFSEQLMEPNQMNPMQDPMQGLQPMAEPEGFGVYGQSLEGFADGGEAVPRETEIMGQPHMLAYINPEEEMMLRQMGGSGDPGPGGVPSYNFFTNLFSSEPTTSEPRGNPAASGERLQTVMAEQKAEKDERPTTTKGALTQAFDDVKMGIGAIFGGETTPGYNERSRLSAIEAEKSWNAGMKKDDKIARQNAAAPVAGIETLPKKSQNIDMKKVFAAAAANKAANTVGTTYVNDPQTIVQPQSSVQGDFRKDYSYLNNDNFFANDLTTDGNSIGFSYGNNGVGGGTVTVNLNGGYDVISMDNSTQTNYSTLDEAMNAVQGISAAPPVVAPPVVAPAATVDPMTPVGGDFLLPGQQNYGSTPAAALNFDPNTYMQTPQNASVALPEMFQQSNPYTFEELLSQYKPAYEPIL